MVAEAMDIWPFPVITEFQDFGEPVKLDRLFSNPDYYTPSLLKTMVSVFPAKVKDRNSNYVYKGVKNTWHQKEMSLYEIYVFVKDKAKSTTLTFRSLTDELIIKDFKETRFNVATFSCTCSYRNAKHVTSLSNLICVDMDKLNQDLEKVRSLVNADPLTLMSFVSPSGTGLKVIYRIDSTKYTHKQYYSYLSDYLCKLCDLPKKKIDESCYDVTRACFLPHDPAVYLNPVLI